MRQVFSDRVIGAHARDRRGYWLFGIGATGELACDVVVGGQNFRHNFSQGRDVYRVGTDIIEPASNLSYPIHERKKDWEENKATCNIMTFAVRR